MKGVDCISCIYFIDDGEFVKIGKANNVESRVKSLQTGNPHILKVNRIVEVPEFYVSEVEVALHRLCQDSKVNGEWFDMSVMNIINQMTDDDIKSLRTKDYQKRDKYWEFREKYKDFKTDLVVDFKNMVVSDLDGNVVCKIVCNGKEKKDLKSCVKNGIALMPEKKDINGKTKKYSAKTGRVTGRPLINYPDNWESVYNEWKAGSITAVAAMKRLNLKKNSFYNLIKRYERKE